MNSYPDFYDAIWAQAMAEADLTGKYTSSLKAWGSMVSRGINGWLRPVYCDDNYFNSGSSACDSGNAFGWVFPAYRTINTKGNLLSTNDPHDYYIYVSQDGWDLTATVTATANGIINPYISLYTSGGVLVASIGPSSSKKATLKYYSVPTGGYVVRVTGTMTAPARGYYNLQLNVR